MLLMGRTQAAMCSTNSCTQLRARCSSSVVFRRLHGQASQATAALGHRTYSPLEVSRYSSIRANETPKEPHCSASIPMKEPGRLNRRLGIGVQAQSQPDYAVQHEPELEVEIDPPSPETLTAMTAENDQIHVSSYPETTVGDQLTVRLAYQGRELPVSDDNNVFDKRAGIDVVHAMKRPTAAETPPQPNTEVLKVYSMEGKQHNLTVTPRVTTAGDIRRAVASATGASRPEVRLQYAGQELNPLLDNRVMQFKPSMFVMHTMKRMQGGSSSSSTEPPGSTLPAPKRCRKPAVSEPLLNPSTTIINPGHAASLAQITFRIVDLDEKFKAKPAVIISKAETAPGGGRGPAVAQLAKQFRDLLKHPIPGVSAAPDNEDPLKWHVRLAGPPGTPYADGWFNVELQFNDNFPGSQPHATFRTLIWHPNVRVCDGHVCVDMGGEVRLVGCVLSALQQLLKHPNTASPFNKDCARQMMESPELYFEKARNMTLEYALK